MDHFNKVINLFNILIESVTYKRKKEEELSEGVDGKKGSNGHNHHHDSCCYY